MRRKTHRHDLYDVNLYFLVLSCLRKCGKGIYTHGNLLKAVAGRGQRHAMAAAERCEALKASLHENRLRLRSCEQAARRNKLPLGTWGVISDSCQKGAGSVHAFFVGSGDGGGSCKTFVNVTPSRCEFPQQRLWFGNCFWDIDLDDLLCMHDEANMAWA